MKDMTKHLYFHVQFVPIMPKPALGADSNFFISQF